MGGFSQPAGIVSLNSVNGTFVNGANGTFAGGGYMVADYGAGVIKQVTRQSMPVAGEAFARGASTSSAFSLQIFPNGSSIILAGSTSYMGYTGGMC